MFDVVLGLQICAFISLMVPYILAATGKWEGKSFKFLFLNVLGGAFMVYVFYIRKDFLFMLLNLIWSIGGIIEIGRKLRKKG